MQPGQQIGHYRILDALGTGAQGAVYRAEDLHLHRTVALKVLYGPQLGESQVFLRFRREAEAASRLDHPGICTVYDADRVDDKAYIAMRYLEGEPLSDVIDRGRADPPSSSTARRDELFARIKIIEDVARALDAAHDVGLVHRDVKPANIMLLDGREPVLCDFGLVHDEGPDSHVLTRTGDVFGTPLYMSPEQIQGKRTDRRSDIFSLGVVAYEFCTGRRPFTGATYSELYEAVVQSDPPRLRAPVPRDLEIVLRTALDKDPDRRYATAAGLADDLRRVREFEPIRARPAGLALRAKRWVQRRPAAAVAIALAVLVCVGGPTVYALQERRARVAVERVSYAASVAAAAANLDTWQIAEAKRRLAQCPEHLRGWEWRYLNGIADSSEIVYRLKPGPPVRSVEPGTPTRLQPFVSAKRGVAEHGGRLAFAAENHSVHVLAGDGALTTMPGHTHIVVDLAFSPDGGLLASASWDRTARVFDRSGRTLHVLKGHAAGLTAAAFTPDGASLVTADFKGGVRVWDVRTGEARVLAAEPRWATRDIAVTADRIYVVRDKLIEEIDLATGESVRDLPRYPGAIWHLALRGDQLACLGAGSIDVWDLPTGKQRLHIPHIPGMTDLVWADGGRLLAGTFTDGSVRAWRADNGNPVFAKTGHDRRPTGLVWSDEHGLVSWGGDQTLRRWKLTPCFARVTLPVDGAQNSVVWHPDGTRVVCGGWSGVVREFDVRTGEELRVVARHEGRATDVAYSIDGTLVASVGTDKTARIDGRVLMETPGNLRSVHFSPNGRHVAFGGVSDRVTVWDLEKNEVAAEFEVDAGLSEVQYDPHTGYLAASFGDGTIRVWDVDRETEVANWIAHTGGTGPIVFHPERRELLSGGRSVVRIWDTTTWEQKAELAGHGAGISGIAISAPERRYFTISSDETLRIWDADNREPLVTLLGVGYLTEAVVRPDGRALAMVGHGRTAHILKSHAR